MDHTAYFGHQRQQEVSSCKILCGDQGGGQDPDKPCYSNLAETCEGQMAKEPTNQINNNFLSGPEHPPKVKYTISTPQHPPKVKYT